MTPNAGVAAEVDESTLLPALRRVMSGRSNG
jgi:hypothetical protein